jgi:hypothetical protein
MDREHCSAKTSLLTIVEELPQDGKLAEKTLVLGYPLQLAGRIRRVKPCHEVGPHTETFSHLPCRSVLLGVTHCRLMTLLSVGQ